MTLEIGDNLSIAIMLVSTIVFVADLFRSK